MELKRNENEARAPFENQTPKRTAPPLEVHIGYPTCLTRNVGTRINFSGNPTYRELARDVGTARFAKRLHLRRAIDLTIFHHEVNFLQAINIV